jgi:crotonyl-CoA reductase
MKLKRIVASHFANYQEAWEMNRLIDRGAIQPVMSQAFPLEEVGEAARLVHHNEAEGKLAVRCLAPEAGQGVLDPAKRERVGVDRIRLFERHAEAGGRAEERANSR